MRALAHICPQLSEEIRYEDTFTNESIYSLIQEITPNFDDLIVHCVSDAFPGKCSDVVAPVLTDEGICFTFNGLNSHDIYTDQ